MTMRRTTGARWFVRRQMGFGFRPASWQGWVLTLSFQVLTPSITLAVAFALALLVADIVMWRVNSALFDRERLLTGARAAAAPRHGDHDLSAGVVRRIPRAGGNDDERRDA